MKDFDWTTFTRRNAIKAPMKEIYDAWTKASEIERWFLKNANYYDLNKQLLDKNLPAQKGFSYEWSWYLYEETEYGKITEANGKDYFQFSFAGDCLVDIKLSEQNDHVIV